MNASERVAKTPDELMRTVAGLHDLQLQCLMSKVMGEPSADQRFLLVQIAQTVLHWAMGTRPKMFADGTKDAIAFIPDAMRQVAADVAAKEVEQFTSICEMLDKCAGDV